MSELLFSCEHLGKTYSHAGVDTVALAEASTSVLPRALIALVGPSGSGKSTLLQLMGGLDIPTSGTISWPALGPREGLRPKQVGYVFQTLSLIEPLTVIENVELPLLLVGEKPEEARKRAAEILGELDLGDLDQKLPDQLSGGQSQRVAIARAFVGRPRLILADEPTGQLDTETAQRLFDVLLKALDASGTALVVATHDLSIAQRLPVQWHIADGHLRDIS